MLMETELLALVPLALVLPAARADLRARTLAFPEAHAVATAVAKREQEAEKKAAAKRAKEPEEAKKKRRKSAKTSDVVTPPPRRGGLSAKEREAYLEIRSGFRFEGEGWHIVDYDIIGTGTEVGRAHLAATVAAAREGDEDAAEGLAYALFTATDYAIFEAAMELAKVYAETGVPRMLRVSLERAHRRFGVEMDEPYRKREDDDD